MQLMVVESPAKAKKIGHALGDDWKVVASYGHIRDLPQHEFGIDATDFSLTYEFSPDKEGPDGRIFPGGEKRVAGIRKLARDASNIVLASDPDREGEAISWHLQETLGLADGDYDRVTFDEITERAVRAALANPRKIDSNLVFAQEARRALDRIVGYQVSGVLSDALGMSLSAGRVQSVVLLLLVDLERRILAFRKTHHFGASISFDKKAWAAKWDTSAFVSEESPYVLDEGLAKRAASARRFQVRKASSQIKHNAPPSPFSTSLMLQAASRALKFNPDVTMSAAQKLFEQGVISYMRTDKVSIGTDANNAIRALAEAKGWPIPAEIRKFKSKGGAQEAHEAVRPTDFSVEEAGETSEQKALYRLIWQRTVASQLADAQYRVNKAELEAIDIDRGPGEPPFVYQASGKVLVVAGWRALTGQDATDEDDDDAEASAKVPVLPEGSTRDGEAGELLRQQTQPPKRFDQASLIRRMEAEGIGRPSTFAAIVLNIMQRNYVREAERLLVPTEVGMTVVDTLVKAGFSFMDIAFTRRLEAQLDEIAEGNNSYRAVVSAAHSHLAGELARMMSSGEFRPRFTCPACEAGMRRYNSASRGPFWKCSGPGCNTYMDDRDGKPVAQQKHECPTCKADLRRYKRNGAPGFLWACTVEGCKTFMDDANGAPIAPKVHECPKCKTGLKRYRRKDKETGKPKGFGWFCPNETCDTFCDDDNGKPLILKRAPCPSCGRDMLRRKGQYGFWWGCTGFRDGCKVMMDDDNGRPVPKGTKPAGKPGAKSVPGRSKSKSPSKSPDRTKKGR